MEKLSLVIFDMDGLMFDTERLTVWAWERAGKDFGYEITPDITIGATGLDARDTVTYFKKCLGENFPYFEIRKAKSAYFDKYIKENGLPVKEGLYELIDFLEKASIPKAVATSTYRKKAEECLSFANVKDRFDLIVCGDDVSRGKPEPDIFLKAAEGLNCLPNECIVLEDSENGLKAALRAKMYPICVPDLKTPSKEVRRLIFKEFSSLLEVKDFLEKEINNLFTKKCEWA
ncbi:MAG: HAD family phosphatase [Tepidanaerobacter acetatoxydans]|uniref:HAD family hydrolase n=1 Tax=Tepidanaerobacter TaxID=499228 RepID=UPI000A63E33B|nr:MULTISPECIES: HAD family phosphatase [Tepidanaerobacter]NLU09884.1 HAD family phosphatase [Tepidanaerobacter acetatoxydans]